MSESRLATYHNSGSVVAMPPGRAMMPSPDDIRSMLELGEQFIKSGLMPATVKTAAAVVVILQKGRELGIPPMQAINGINVIQGKPTCSADLMQALIYRDHGDNALRWIETSAERVTLAYKRRGWDKASTFTWTREDSHRAGLRGGNHDKYPGAMMRARAVSAVARMAFNDTIGGMHLPDEIEESPVSYDQPRPKPAIRVEEEAVPDEIDVEFVDAERRRASDALHAAGGAYGMDHDDIRRFIAERSGKPEAELSSMTEWDVRQFRWAKLQVDRFARDWVAAQEQDPSDVASTDDDIDIDPDTGEIIPTVLPAVPASLLTDADVQAERRDPERWTH